MGVEWILDERGKEKEEKKRKKKKKKKEEERRRKPRHSLKTWFKQINDEKECFWNLSNSFVWTLMFCFSFLFSSGPSLQFKCNQQSKVLAQWEVDWFGKWVTWLHFDLLWHSIIWLLILSIHMCAGFAQIEKNWQWIWSVGWNDQLHVCHQQNFFWTWTFFNGFVFSS